MRLQKLTLLKKHLSLTLSLAIFAGCSSNQVILYPIKKTDICVKGDVDCDMCKMDIGMSDFYLKRVLEAKIKN